MHAEKKYFNHHSTLFSNFLDILETTATIVSTQNIEFSSYLD